MMRSSPLMVVLLAVLAAGACAGEGEPEDADEGMQMESQEEATSMQAQRSVEIVSPAEGATVEGPQITVELAAHGFEVVPAGDTTSNSGHHHLYLDRDVNVTDRPVPNEEGHIIHMGDGSSTFTFENVEPGQHRLIAVVGDFAHVPVAGLQDTVTFTVE